MSIPLPVICATNLCSCQKWFVHLKSLMNHPILKEDEKFLWLWLATCSANNHSLTCSISYEQISHAVNKPVKDIHRCLFRLKLMGILCGDIPIWYGIPTPEMVSEVRKIKLVLMEREFVEVTSDSNVLLRPIKNREELYARHAVKLKMPRIPDNAKWVKEVFRFVKRNHDFRVIFRRMILN